jgi:predicted site-specific integrase-resolvase
MEKLYNVTEFAELIGKSVKTMQRWDRDGVLTAYRSPSGRRYYTHAQYKEYIGETNNEDKQNVIYCRVSTKNQADDLENQLKFLKNYCTNKGIPISNIYTDFGSGLNYNRRNWNKLIDDCLNGKIDKVYISHRDRFVRFGYEWICNLLEKLSGVTVIAIDDKISSPEEEIIQDLISIIHVFSSRIYGLRKYKSKINKELHKHE